MTVEECVIEIQNGKEELTPQLWNRVRGIYYKKAGSYYARHKERCDRCGVTAEDILQQSFFAFLRSVQAYEPLCEYSFSAYINYPFMSEMQALTYSRTSKQRADALNVSDSLDKEIETADGVAGTLADLVQDPDALYFLDQIDADSEAETIRAEVRRLREPLCGIISGFFFDGLTLEQLGKLHGISYQRAAQLKSDGLRELRKRRVLVDLWNESNRTERLRLNERAARGNVPDRFSAVKKYERYAARLERR